MKSNASSAEYDSNIINHTNNSSNSKLKSTFSNQNRSNATQVISKKVTFDPTVGRKETHQSNGISRFTKPRVKADNAIRSKLIQFLENNGFGIFDSAEMADQLNTPAKAKAFMYLVEKEKLGFAFALDLAEEFTSMEKFTTFKAKLEYGESLNFALINTGIQ